MKGDLKSPLTPLYERGECSHIWKEMQGKSKINHAPEHRKIDKGEFGVKEAR